MKAKITIAFILALFLSGGASASWDIGGNTYPYKDYILNETTHDLGMGVNGTAGFYDNIIWFNPTQGDMNFYYNNSTYYTVAYNLNEGYYETEGGGLYNLPESIWNSSATGVYHFDSDGTDSTSNNNDLTTEGTNNTYTSSVFGSGVDLGEQSGFSITNNLFSSQGTIVLWVNFEGGNTDSYSDNIISDRDDTDSDWSVQLLHDSADYVSAYTMGASETNLVSSTNYQGSAWHFIAFTWDNSAGTAYLYVNGSLEDSNSNLNYSDSSETIYVGYTYYDGASDRDFDGKMDELRVYDRALTQPEIQELYNNSQELNNQLNLKTPVVSFESDTTSSGDNIQDYIFCNVTVNDESQIENSTIYLENDTWSKEVINTTNPAQWSYNFTGLSYGNYTLKSWAYDVDGWKTLNSSRSITLKEPLSNLYFFNRDTINITTDWIVYPFIDEDPDNDSSYSTYYGKNGSIYYNNDGDFCFGKNDAKTFGFSTFVDGAGNRVTSGNYSGQLVFWTPLDNGNAKDFIGDNDESAGHYTSGVSGKVKLAYDFNSTNDDFVEFSTVPAVDVVGNFSVSLWFNTDSLHSTTDGEILSHTKNASNRFGITVTNGNLAVAAYNGTNWRGLQSFDSVSTDTWYQVVYTYNDGNGTLYVNNIEYTGSTTPSTTSSAGFRIGLRADAVKPFDGTIDDVRIYDTKLSSSDVDLLYKSTEPVSGYDPTFGTQQGEAFALALNSPVNQTYTTQNVWVNGSTSYNGNISYSLDGGSWNNIANDTKSYSTQLTGLSQGGHNVSVYGYLSGNQITNDSAYVEFTVNLPPSVSLDSPNPGENKRTGVVDFGFTPVDRDLSKAELYINTYTSYENISDYPHFPHPSSPDPLNLTYYPNESTGDSSVLTASDVGASNFVADPYWVPHNGDYYLFFERQDGGGAADDIGVAKCNGSNPRDCSYLGIAIDTGVHSSYPYVFKEEGTWIAIILDSGVAKMYNISDADFPGVTNQWTYQGSVTGVSSAKDYHIFRFNDRWWFGYGTDDGTTNGGYRMKYTAKGVNATELDTASWTDHPDNPLISGNSSSARPGGRPIVRNNYVILPYQDCAAQYGDKLRLFNVTTLSTTAFSRTEYAESPVLEEDGDGWNSDRMHHLDCAWDSQDGTKRWLCAVDGGNATGEWSIGVYATNITEGKKGIQVFRAINSTSLPTNNTVNILQYNFTRTGGYTWNVKVTDTVGQTDWDTERTINIKQPLSCSADVCVNTSGWWRNDVLLINSSAQPLTDGVSNATSGDTIQIEPAIYSEGLTFDKNLKLLGNSSNKRKVELQGDYTVNTGFLQLWNVTINGSLNLQPNILLEEKNSLVIE